MLLDWAWYCWFGGGTARLWLGFVVAVLLLCLWVSQDDVETRLRDLARILEAKDTETPSLKPAQCKHVRVSGGLSAAVECCTREAVAFTPRIVSGALRVVSAALVSTPDNRSFVLLSNFGAPLVDVLAACLDQIINTKDVDALISQVRARWVGGGGGGGGGARGG